MVTVVIPTYNEEKALPHTLRELLHQAGDYEAIVIDGGSTDGTRNIIKEFGFVPDASRLTFSVSRLTFHAPKGRASQMNAGAKEACGEWLLFLHADTVLLRAQSSG